MENHLNGHAPGILCRAVRRIRERTDRSASQEGAPSLLVPAVSARAPSDSERVGDSLRFAERASLSSRDGDSPGGLAEASAASERSDSSSRLTPLASKAGK